MTLYGVRLTLEPNPNGIYSVTSPDVPGLVTEGSTAAEIQANVQEAIEALLEAWRELAQPLPPGISRENVRQVK